MIRLLLVCGAWGGGTSLVTELLAKLGATALGPLLATADPRTPNSFEHLAFRKLLHGLADERRFALRRGAAKRVLPALQRYRDRIRDGEFGRYDEERDPPIVLKHPLSALIVREICAVFETKLVYVQRPLEELEATRLRRGWPTHQGARGGEAVHTALFGAFAGQAQPIAIVRYRELLTEPAPTIRALAAFANLDGAAAEQIAQIVRR